MKKLLIIASCFIFVGIGSALGLELPKHSKEIGIEASHIKYEEPDVMKETGLMYGIVGSYTYHGELLKLQKCMLKAEARYAFGQVDYKNSGTLNNVDDYILEFRGLGGYDFSVFTASILTPYTGLGYRYLNDDMKGITSIGSLGYERESNYIYSPIGIEIATPLKNNWSVTTILEYDYFWKGIQKSHLGDIAGCYDIENDQKDGYGLRGSVEFRKKSEKRDYVIAPFIRYWNIETSELAFFPGGYGYEPENNSTEVGIKVAVKF